jgi:two-component system, NtrC family, response regulator AtoC
MLAQSCQAVNGEGLDERRLPNENSRTTVKNSPRSRILVVDDEALIRWSVSETLAAHDYVIEEAADGASAIQAMSSHGSPIDLVLLDLRLPDCDDLQVVAAIRHRSPATCVILMTAFGSSEIVQEARRLGVCAVMDKPFEMEALPPLVARALAARPQ